MIEKIYYIHTHTVKLTSIKFFKSLFWRKRSNRTNFEDVEAHSNNTDHLKNVLIQNMQAAMAYYSIGMCI